MISILTLTYHRKALLEEAMYSFISQNYLGCDYEMVIINDSNLVEYVYNSPIIRIINQKERFSSIAAKIEFGYKQCKYDYIYRLDDDDLLAPHAIEIIHNNIVANPGYDIYRSKSHYFFHNNKFIKLSDNVNTGNMYTKKYLNRITFPNKTSNEDVDITFNHSATMCENKTTMIYRWGTGHYHISGIGTGPKVLEQVDRQIDPDRGVVSLVPKFLNDYYGELPKNDSKQ